MSAFEAFGGHGINPTKEALSQVNSSGEMELCRVLLPVTWEGAVKTLFTAWDEFSPDVVLMTGLAGGSDAIRVERLGINLCGALRDNDGLYPNGTEDLAEEKRIIPDAPDALFATYPHGRILSALKEAKLPCRDSFHAGTYLCNAVLFSSLWRASREEKPVTAGFIHVPFCENQKENAPFLPLAQTIRALEIVLGQLF